jgi:tetratricopeptide (TPR) repeat protein
VWEKENDLALQAVAHNDLGCVFERTGRQPEALQEFVVAIELAGRTRGGNSSLCLSILNKGEALSSAGNVREAEADLSQARTLAEETPRRDLLPKIFTELGVLRQRLGEDREAADLYRKALEAHENLVKDNPGSTEAQDGLAWFLANCGDSRLRDPARAVELAGRAVEAAPEQGLYWRTLGLARYRNGDWKETLSALDKAMQNRSGGDSSDWFILAMACWRLGEKDKARDWYDKAVAWMNKNQPQVEELKRFRAEAAALLGVADGAGGKDAGAKTPTPKPPR